MDNVFNLLKDNLPHGSGIDADWSFEVLKNNKVRAYNSYHAMNETGMYWGWLDFHVTFIINQDGNFEVDYIQITDKLPPWQYDLKEYLYQTIFHEW